jgi:hypothetical protein
LCVSWFSAPGKPVALPSAKHEVKTASTLVCFRQLPRQGPVSNNNNTRPSALAETRGCYQLAGWAVVVELLFLFTLKNFKANLS